MFSANLSTSINDPSATFCFVLFVRPKVTDLTFHLFGRSIHPELFDACASRVVERKNYRLQVNITSAGHWVSFENKGLLVSEVCASSHHPLPQQNRLFSQALQSSHEQHCLVEDRLHYQSRFQIEGVNPRMFVTIAQQLKDQGQCEGLVHQFESSGRMAMGAISYVNIQAFSKKVLVRSLHTFPDTCAVVKSESTFEIRS